MEGEREENRCEIEDRKERGIDKRKRREAVSIEALYEWRMEVG